MLKCAPGVWRKRELYIIEKSLTVFEKKKYYAENVASCPGLPYYTKKNILVPKMGNFNKGKLKKKHHNFLCPYEVRR